MDMNLLIMDRFNRSGVHIVYIHKAELFNVF